MKYSVCVCVYCLPIRRLSASHFYLINGISVNNQADVWLFADPKRLQRHFDTRSQATNSKSVKIHRHFLCDPRLKVFNRGKLGRESGRKRKMEDFLATVRSISADKNYVQLADFLNRSNELLAKHAGQIDAAIASLDPDQHTLAFMALL